MKYVKMLGLLAVAMMAFAASASATSVTTTTGGAAATPTIHAVNENGHVKLANPIANIECSSTVELKIESHGAGVTATGNIFTIVFNGCTNSWHVTTVKPGNFQVHYTSAHNGTVTSSGLQINTTRFGLNCNYETNNTHIGTLTGGNPGTLHLDGLLPLAAGSSGLCGSGPATLSGSYLTTSALYVAA